MQLCKHLFPTIPNVAFGILLDHGHKARVQIGLDGCQAKIVGGQHAIRASARFKLGKRIAQHGMPDALAPHLGRGCNHVNIALCSVAYGSRCCHALASALLDHKKEIALGAQVVVFENGRRKPILIPIGKQKEDEGNIELFGTKAGAKLSPNVEIFTELNNRMVNISFAQPTALNFNGLFQKEINNYVDAILGKAECLAPAEDGVEMMKILDAVYESARTGHEVIL